MRKQKVFVWIVLCLALLTGGAALAQRGARNVSAKAHPNLAAAQRLVVQAIDRIVTAQKANEFDLGGHAQKAKELLAQASDELKLAAETSNQNKK